MKCQLGSSVTSLSGRLGGMAIQVNNFKTVLRTVVPYRFRSRPVSNGHANSMSALASAWRKESLFTKNVFIQFVKTDPYCILNHISAFQYFVKINSHMFPFAGYITYMRPSRWVYSNIQFTSLVMSANRQQLMLSWSGSMPVNSLVTVYVSKAFPPNISLKGKHCYAVGVIVPNYSSPLNCISFFYAVNKSYVPSGFHFRFFLRDECTSSIYQPFTSFFDIVLP